MICLESVPVCETNYNILIVLFNNEQNNESGYLSILKTKFTNLK